MPKATPSVKDKSLDEKLPQKEIEFLEDLRAKVKTDDRDRGNWKLKMIASSNQRLGVKRMSNWPYPDAPNIPLPETDKLIKKQTPPLVLSIWAPKKMCKVNVEQGTKETSQLKFKAQKAEMAMNMILRTKMDLYNKFELAADYAKEKGHCIAKVVEEFKSRKVHKVIDLDDYPKEQVAQLKTMRNADLKQFLYDRYDLDPEDEDDKATCKDIIDQFKSGETIIEFDVERITSLPNIEVPLPTKVIVPGYVTDINKAPRITYEYFLTRYEIESRIDKEIFLKKDMDELDFSGVAKTDLDWVERQKGMTEGVSDNVSNKDLFRIHEICYWYKPKKTSQPERWVATFFADVYDVEEALLQRIAFPFEFEGWNYEKYDNEKKDPRYYNARGVPEQVRALQEIMERNINNEIIRDEMNNNPTYEVLNTSELLDRHIRFVPGEMIPVSQLGTEIRRLNEPITVDVSSDRMLQVLKAYTEEYQGNIDQLFRNATNVGGGKTLGEVQEGIRATSGPLNVEVIRWNEFWTKVYNKVFDIMKERLGDSIFIGNVEITREDFNFPAEVKSNGSLEVADKEMATFKAYNRIQVISAPVFGDCVNSEDKYNAIKDWLEKDGVKDPDEFCTDPKIIAQTQIRQMQGQLQQMGQQAQMLQQQIQQGQKEVAKVQKRGQEVVQRTQGQLEALANA